MPIDQKLLSAIQSGNLDDINDAINKEVNINAVDDDGNSPLHLAAMYDKPLVFCALLQAGGDLSAKNNLGEDPYDCADNNLIADMIIARWEMDLFSNNPESERYLEKKEEYEATVAAVPMLSSNEASYQVLINSHMSDMILRQSAEQVVLNVVKRF